MKVLILGCNGFIGSALAEAILSQTTWDVYGMDLGTSKLSDGDLLLSPHFNFFEGDITINHEWIEYHVKKCDVVIPLVALANPTFYVKEPLRVFELDFEANLRVVRLCVKYNKRLIFPSTSEVYGMTGGMLTEDESPMTYGPIHKQRWIYAASKQLLDRVIYAYGIHERLNYTLIRPFNWIGPKLDALAEPKEGSSRVLTQFLSDIIYHEPIRLVNGGEQRRCFTYIDDGIDAVMRILKDDNGYANRMIFNIGNPANNVSMLELANLLLDDIEKRPGWGDVRTSSPVVPVTAQSYYGKGYQDIEERIPGIVNARGLGWCPKVGLADAIRLTVDYHLNRLKR